MKKKFSIDFLKPLYRICRTKAGLIGLSIFSVSIVFLIVTVCIFNAVSKANEEEQIAQNERIRSALASSEAVEASENAAEAVSLNGYEMAIPEEEVLPQTDEAAVTETQDAVDDSKTDDTEANTDTEVSDSGNTEEASDESNTQKAPVTFSEFRGVWFSFHDWQSYLQGKNEADFRAAFENICINTADNGMNTIIVHVRSHNDAVYPSHIYPWSTEMMNGVDPGYDPLAIMVDIAHKHGLAIHAWINPYGYRNGEYCGDASLATHDNIIAGISEILEGYAVDGIHFDDYFPPLGAESHNNLIREVYGLTHSYGKTFGVSPGGNIDNNMSNGIDVRTWVSQSGYVDYICPQLYWTDHYGNNADVTMYSDRLKAWKKMNTAHIPMYIGLAAYRTGSGASGDPGWGMADDNLAYQLDLLRSSDCQGFVLYSYDSIISSQASAEMRNLRDKL